MLYIHRSERADPLAAALAQVLAQPVADPFSRELVAVPTRGMERWLTQRLSARLGASPAGTDGIAAAIDFPFPSTLVSGAVASAAGIDPDRDPWLSDRLVWPLLQVTEAARDEEWLKALAVHLRPPAGERRFVRLAKLARLFSHYATDRPGLLLDWLAGDDSGAGRAPWQPELFRRLREHVGVPSPAERLGPACERLAAEPAQTELPARLAVFGLTRIPQAQLRVLEAIAVGRDVHLMVLHPSPTAWERGEAENRLLASWGRESDSLRRLLAGTRTEHHALVAAPESSTLLSRLQADIRDDRPSPGIPLPGRPDGRLELPVADTSIRIHSCHGRARQVEVMREAILHRLQDDPTLEPRDILVMCPNVEVFAPLIEAVFEGGELAVRIADRSLRQTNPILNVIARLLDYPNGRVTASEVLDLADSPPLRRRFALRDDDLSKISEWVADAQIHWGLDAEQRAQFKLSEVDAGTWAAGLRRLLLAVSIDDSAGLYGGVIAARRLDSGEIGLVGRLAELAARLQSAVSALSGPQTIAEWAGALTRAADALTATSEEDGWQRRALDRLIAEITQSAADAVHAPRLTLAEIRELIGSRLEGRPTRANFRTGHLTVCTLSPMRSIPHRVVCILGLDDGHFPRAHRLDGDDLLAAAPQPGDRDVRAEDRQLLLDALMAAQEALIIAYSGNDERTNAPRPPAVPVGELLDAIDASARTERPGEPARSRVLVHHPLQSFDPRNFTSGARSLAADGRPWSFDKVALDGARAFTGQRTRTPPFLPSPLPDPPAAGVLALDDLIRFTERPVRAFLRQRLGLSLTRSDDEIEDALPVELDGLAKWSVGQRLLEALVTGVDGREACLAEVARGSLPPGQMARAVIREVYPRAAAVARAAAAFSGSVEPRSLESNVLLPDGTRLTGTVSGVRGEVLTAVSYSRLNARQRIGAWVRLLALTAAHPQVPFEALTVARARGGAQKAVEVARIPALGGDAATRQATAVEQLQALAQLRAEGMREPLPLPPDSTFAYAHAQFIGGEDPAAAAGEVWRDRFVNRIGLIEGEHARDENPVVIGPDLNFARLEQLAPRLWQELLSRERVERA